MRFETGFLLLGCAAAQLQYGQHPSDTTGESPTGSVVTVTFMSEIYTIPVFDPSLAPTYGASRTTIYRPSETTERATHSNTAAPHSSVSSTVASTRQSSIATASTLETSSSTLSNAASSIPPAPIEQTGNSASRIPFCAECAIAGGVLAGIAWM